MQHDQSRWLEWLAEERQASPDPGYADYIAAREQSVDFAAACAEACDFPNKANFLAAVRKRYEKHQLYYGAVPGVDVDDDFSDDSIQPPSFNAIMRIDRLMRTRLEEMLAERKLLSLAARSRKKAPLQAKAKLSTHTLVVLAMHFGAAEHKRHRNDLEIFNSTSSKSIGSVRATLSNGIKLLRRFALAYDPADPEAPIDEGDSPV